MRFLCKQGGYYSHLDLTDAGLLAKATERGCGANQAFNITNSYLFRLIANYFGFGAGAPLQMSPERCHGEQLRNKMVENLGLALANA
ncbi:Rossmann-fold NAD(P)-binding domain-containing protein [Peribacillus frigoritolerans]|uniref:Uncharacterized protein n=1 Tax=Peribacillus castrilensis TaxID=2897690 RepID=A0AAW9NFB9_9BACI|nr:hypothetical protein [Peribacillus castrilensis]